MYKRIEILRDNMLNVSHSKYRICTEMTFINDDNKIEPLIIRKAKALKMVLKEMSIYIQPFELIVGGRTLFSPPDSNQSLKGGLGRGEAEFLPDEVTIAKQGPKFEFYPHYATEKERYIGKNFNMDEGFVSNHCVAGFEKVLKIGIKGIFDEANDRQQELMEEKGNKAGVDFLEAVKIVMNAMSNFIERFEKEANRLWESNQQDYLKEDLSRIEKVCKNIQVNPPRNFHEALQLVYFTQIITIIENYNLMGFGRVDQYMYPFYKRDIENKVITKAEAQELLDCFFIKSNDTSDIHTDSGWTMTLSGQTSDGNDATNELTYMCLKAKGNTKMVDPKFDLRIHSNTPEEFLDEVFGFYFKNPKLTMPRVYNDNVVISSLVKIGIPIEDARCYGIDVCQDIMIPGKSDFYPAQAGSYGTYLLDILQKTIGSLKGCSNFEEFFQKYCDELQADIRQKVMEENVKEYVASQISPVPFLSATLEGCIKKAKDKTEGGTIYNHTGFVGHGFVNLVNSMKVIKWIFNSNIPRERLLEALDTNFDNNEIFRQKLINKVPKWGNDNDVDLLGKKIAEFFAEEVLKYKNARGGRYLPGLFTHHQVRLGNIVSALPDGRKKGESLAISLSPSRGTKKNGYTAVIKSASKINQILFPLGTSLDFTFSTSSVNAEIAKSLYKTYFQLGGISMQSNYLSKEMLLDAQKNPETYKDLVIRVWGFDAYFVSLSREYQNDIIERVS